jgi:hypothetical protein
VDKRVSAKKEFPDAMVDGCADVVDALTYDPKDSHFMAALLSVLPPTCRPRVLS